MIGVGVFILFLIGLEKGGEDVAFKVEGLTLTTVWRAWVKDGKPTDIDLSRYIGETSAQLSVLTNQILITATPYKARFGLRSARFSRPGLLVITEEGEFIWMDDRGDVHRVDAKVKFD
jgi:hypothetical protein